MRNTLVRLLTPTAPILLFAMTAACGFQQNTGPIGPTAVSEPAGGGEGPSGGSTAAGPPRTPDPADGDRLPLPDMSGVVAQVAAEHPEALQNSCQEFGGSWEFLDLVVDELRKYDTRWGYNWKRGNVGDPSKDIVDYHWGPGEDEGSTDVYIIDVVQGHCSGNPTPIWSDVTDVTFGSGTVGRWTGRGRF
jgi:hypothetical protein